MLARAGREVTVLEQDAAIGGCLRSYRRHGQLFDTGFHYVGGLDEGQMLRRLFTYYDLMGLPWVRMDDDCFDEVVIAGERFRHAQGYERFAETMKSYFPARAANIDAYVATLREVGEKIAAQLNPRSPEEVYTQSLFARSAWQYLRDTVVDERLIAVLSGASMKMELNRDKLPLYVYAQINSQSIQSAYRLRGGGQQIADHLAASIEALGGRVLTGRSVTAFEGANGVATAALVNGGEERHEAEQFICDTHPAICARLLSEGGLVRKVYKSRMTSLANTFGMCTVSLALKPGRVPYRNRNVFIYSDWDVWGSHVPDELHVRAVMLSFAPPADGGEWATQLDLLAPMNWEALEPWFGTKVGKRGCDYEQFKARHAEKCIDMASREVAGLRDAIAATYVSTPLTYRDYTGTEHGAAYGIRKDWQSPMFTVLTPRTPVANVLMTGQNLNLHGIMGVSMTTLFTCAELLGMDRVRQQIGL